MDEIKENEQEDFTRDYKKLPIKERACLISIAMKLLEQQMEKAKKEGTGNNCSETEVYGQVQWDVKHVF